MSEQVNVYVDVDGVLLGFTEILNMTTAAEGWRTYEPGFSYNVNVVAALNEIAARPNVTMHWLTTWRERAASVLSPKIGLRGEGWTVLPDPYRGDDPWWKLQIIAAHQPDVRKVWLDDDISDDLDALDWLHEHREVRWLSPSTYTGLRVCHTRMIDAWTTPAPRDAHEPAAGPAAGGEA